MSFPPQGAGTGEIGTSGLKDGAVTNAKVNAAAAIALSKLAALGFDFALQTDGAGEIEASTITATELGYLDGVTSLIQTQLNSKKAVFAGIARDDEITLPAQASRVLMYDVVADAEITITSLPWWNKGSTTLDISQATQDTSFGDIISSFISGFSVPRGLTWDGVSLWANPEEAAKIVSFTPAGSVVSSFTVAGVSFFISGLGFDGNNLYVVIPDAAPDRKVHEITRTGTLVSSFAFDQNGMRSIVWDGSNFQLSVEGSVDKIFKLEHDGTVVSSFASPDTSPQGVAWDGTYIFNNDNSADKMYQLTTTGTIVSSFALTDGHGLTWDGKNLWVSENVNDKIIKMKDGLRNVRFVAVET